MCLAEPQVKRSVQDKIIMCEAPIDLPDTKELE